MWKWIDKIGTTLFDVIFITLGFVLSFFLIIPFIPFLTGVTAYFLEPFSERKLRTIFTSIRDNSRILLFYEIVFLPVLAFAALNIYYFQTHPAFGSELLLFFSWLVVVLLSISLVNTPTLINTMKVNRKELFYNSIMLSLVNPLRGLTALLLYGGVIVVFQMSFWFALLLLFPVIGGVTWLVNQNLMDAKRRRFDRE